VIPKAGDVVSLDKLYLSLCALKGRGTVQCLDERGLYSRDYRRQFSTVLKEGRGTPDLLE